MAEPAPPPYEMQSPDSKDVATSQSNGIAIGGTTVRVCVHDGVKMASLVDYVMLVRGLGRNAAGNYLREQSLTISDTNNCPVNIYKCRFEKNGKASPGVPATQLVKLTFKIASGSKFSTEVINKWATDIARLEGGDKTLVKDIEKNAKLAEENPDGPNAFMKESVAAELQVKRSGGEIQSASGPLVKRTRRALEPTDIAYWRSKRNGGKSAEEALVLALQCALLGNSEALAADKRAEEQERCARARAEEVERKEAAKRETMRLAHEHAMAAQELIRRLDARFYQMRDMNEEMTAAARKGPCFYFVDSLDATVMFGMTGNSMHQRYKKEKNKDVILANVLAAAPASHRAQAIEMERTFKVFVKEHARHIRMADGHERLVNNYESFARVMTKWNEFAKEEGWAVFVLP